MKRKNNEEKINFEGNSIILYASMKNVKNKELLTQPFTFYKGEKKLFINLDYIKYNLDNEAKLSKFFENFIKQYEVCIIGKTTVKNLLIFLFYFSHFKLTKIK